MDEFYKALGKKIAEYHTERCLPLEEKTIAPLRHIGEWAREWQSKNIVYGMLSINEKLLTENAKLRRALEGYKELFENQDIVRNTDHDLDVSAFIKQGLRITKILQRAQDVLKETGGEDEGTGK